MLVDKLLELLNSMLQEDPVAVKNILTYYVNSNFNESSVIIISEEDGKQRICSLGLLNTVLLLDNSEYLISAIIDTDTKELVGFTTVKTTHIIEG